MKKYFLVLLATFALLSGSVAQKASLHMPILIKGDDGDSMYELQKGDKLVYRINTGSAEYDFIVTINESDDKGLDFNYEMTNANNTSGHVLISNKAKSDATRYTNFFRGGELSLTDASTVWLSYKNFGDMPERKTTMQIDNGSPETFYRPEKDEVYPIVKIKGEDKKIDAFIISNAADGKGGKTMWINGISSNPLIVKMDLGWTVELKEIR
jgi:hypothetical protein